MAEMLKRGCKVAMGIDGQAFDEDDDALREIRLLWFLHVALPSCYAKGWAEPVCADQVQGKMLISS